MAEVLVVWVAVLVGFILGCFWGGRQRDPGED